METCWFYGGKSRGWVDPGVVNQGYGGEKLLGGFLRPQEGPQEVFTPVTVVHNPMIYQNP